MRLNGKKVGKFQVVTVLATYNLDVRLDMERNIFTIHVPAEPGGTISSDRETRNYESFSAPTLDEVKKATGDFLRSRDQTEFVDVIEYTYAGASVDSRSSFAPAQNYVGFDFRVARVSLAVDRSGRPKLEVPVAVDSHGNITVETSFGVICGPQAHKWQSFPAFVPFTVERWRKCCVIRDGIIALDKMLFALLGDDGEKAAAKLDAVGSNPLLLTANSEGDFRSPPRSGPKEA